MADPELVDYLRAAAPRFGTRQVCEKLLEEGVDRREIAEALASAGCAPSIARLMVKLAGAAAAVADREFSLQLDFSEASLKSFDRILESQRALKDVGPEDILVPGVRDDPS